MSDAETTDYVSHAKRRRGSSACKPFSSSCGSRSVLGMRNETTYSRTTHLVLHPDSSVPAAQVPQAIDVLNGSLVQTVLRVLNSGAMLDQSAAAGHVANVDGISLDATVQPGSAYFDATVHGDDRARVDAVSRAFTGVASGYVDRTYSGYDLETLGASTATDRSFPPSPAVATLSLLLGVLLGLALVYIEWIAHRPRFAATILRTMTAPAQPSAAAVVAVDADAEPEPTPTPPRAKSTPAKKRATGTTPKRSTTRAAAAKSEATSAADTAETNAAKRKPAAARPWKPRSTSGGAKRAPAATPAAQSTSGEAPV